MLESLLNVLDGHRSKLLLGNMACFRSISGSLHERLFAFRRTIIKSLVGSYCKKAALLALFGVLLGLFVPGAISYRFGTFFPDDVIEKIPDKTVKEQVNDYNAVSKVLNTAIPSIDRLIAEELKSSPGGALNFLKLRQETVKLISNMRPPFYVIGFYPDPLMFLWPVLYVSFFWLLFIVSPTVHYYRRPLSYLVLLTGLEIFYRWPTWMRNSGLLRNSERKVYAYANVDISVLSFLVQESQTLVVAICILEFLLIWSLYFAKWRGEVLAIRGTSKPDAGVTYEFMRATGRQFVHWQVCSVLLAIAFAPYTFLFWRYVIDFGDLRYPPRMRS